MSFSDLAHSRFSERRFAPEPVEQEKLDAIVEAGRCAPTAHNKQPQRILIVRTPEGLEKIDKGTGCRFGAPVVFILAYDMERASRHPDVVDFGVMDTSIVGTHMMLQAADLGVHSCWVGLIDPSELRRQFNIPRSYRIVSVMPMGYPSERSKPSVLHEKSVPVEDLFFYETYEQGKDA